MTTYHGIDKAVCLNCGKVTTSDSDLEIMNDLDPTCECGVHDTLWVLADGTRRITSDPEDEGTTWFTVVQDPSYGVYKAAVGAVDNGPTMTLGQFRKITSDVPDNVYVTAYSPDTGWYHNLDVTSEAVDAMRAEDGQPSLILDIKGEVDTRQW
jgi:hypothetical protein